MDPNKFGVSKEQKDFSRSDNEGKIRIFIFQKITMEIIKVRNKLIVKLKEKEDRKMNKKVDHINVKFAANHIFLSLL